MLRQAVETAQSGGADTAAGDLEWTPQLNLGLEVRIPEDYVTDLTVRLSLYRRIAGLDMASEADGLIAELVDRFGPLPDSVRNLLAVIELKQLARKANIEKVEVGPKGMSLAFRNNEFSKPDQLVAWIAGKQGRVQLRADHKLVLQQPMAKVDERPAICKQVVQELLALAV